MHDQAGSVEEPAGRDTERVIRSFETSFTSLKQDGESFAAAANQIASFQRRHLDLYGRYWDALGTVATPFLPIRAFKESPIMVGDPREAEAVFVSSGTGEKGRSRHFIRKTSVYRRSFETHFERLIGPGPITFVAHLPAYSDLGSQSSLVYMANGIIERFGDRASGLFLDDTIVLSEAIRHSEECATSFVLLGAAFGLQDLAKTDRWRLPPNAIVIETGGMKTRARHTDRRTLHETISTGFGVDPDHIWSEYGMCEMLSQCYAVSTGAFFPPPWVRFEIRDIQNPLIGAERGEAGLLAVMDLANMYSVSAILTEDLAVQEGSGFRLLGRVEGADLRGCNQLVESIQTVG